MAFRFTKEERELYFESDAERKYESAPYLGAFNPKVIPYQWEVVKLIRKTFDYSKGTPEILLSGSYGSAKSCAMSHLVVSHCLFNPGARACIARRAMPDLKKTILNEILDHISKDMIEGEDYTFNRSDLIIRFKNGSEIICLSWSDKKYNKGRSLKLSCLCIEELTENNDEDMAAFKTLKARLRRIPGIKENFLITASNPDGPSHWAYKYFIEPTLNKKHPTRFVFYSITDQNPFLDKVYVEQLKKDLPPREADRYLRGLWIELDFERIYYEYQRENNFIDADYKVDENYPVYISWDFNIGEGKPLSAVCFQYIDDEFHLFNEVVVEGMRTRESCDELASKGLLDSKTNYILTGDAAGKHRDTRSNNSDYDIIKKFFANYKSIDFEIVVFRSNQPIRDRHNLVNGYCCNDLDEHRLTVYKQAIKADEGLRLTAPKKGANMTEDDSKDYQHITTAIGYGIRAAKYCIEKTEQRTIQL